ncbi:hypothetical protein [Streptomyces jeddahensis]|nr:hypothetical protein [Streptomyces jeddahensis]
MRCRAAVLSAVLILALAGCGQRTGGSGKASPRPVSPSVSLAPGKASHTPASPSVGPAAEEGWRSAYVSESDDAEIMDVAAASATEGWAIGRDRAHLSTATEKADGYSTFFLHYDGKTWHVAAELPKLAPPHITWTRAGSMRCPTRCARAALREYLGRRTWPRSASYWTPPPRRG